MKKTILVAITLTLTALCATSSTYYGFKIGGVAVNSDNYTNVKGSTITANITGEPYKVSYDPTTKVVTLNNVKIERTGNDNRCIYNESCDGLTVYFSTNNSRLSSTTCAPIRIEANTTFSCEALVRVNVYGSDGDANCLYATNGATVTFDHATCFMYLTGNSNAAITSSSTTNEKIVFHHSRVYARSANGNALSRFSSVTSDGSALLLRTGSETANAVSSVKAFSIPTYTTMTVGYNDSISNFTTYTYTGTATFSTSKQTFIGSNNQALPGKDIIISQRIPVNETNFPDATLRAWVTDNYGTTLETWDIFQRRTINVQSSGNETLKNVEDWTGMNYFMCFRRLWVEGGRTKTLRLAANKEFYHLRCYDNQLGIVWSELTSSLNMVPSGNEGVIEGFNVTVSEHNPLPTRTQLGYIKSKGFDFIVKNSDQTYSLNALEDYTPIDMAHFPDDALRAFLYGRLYGYDAAIYASENATIYDLDIKNSNIADLTGIEYLTNIQRLYCYQNNISSLNISQNTKLTLIYCYWNNIKSEAWEQFVTTAPTMTNRLEVYCCFPSGNYENNDEPTYAQVAQAKAKNIYFFKHNGSKWEEMSDVPPAIKGDVNGDGKVNVSDVTTLINMILGVIEKNEQRADINGDGKINVSDVTALINLILGVQ